MQKSMDSGNVAIITKKQRQATKWLKKPRSLSSSGSCFAEKKMVFCIIRFTSILGFMFSVDFPSLFVFYLPLDSIPCFAPLI